MRQKLILRCHQSPGDIVMMTAAIRDLHRKYRGEYMTDVRTPCPQLWDGNHKIEYIVDGDPEARVIEMQYPLIHGCNSRPWHFIHGFRMFLEVQLNRGIPQGPFQGDITLQKEEREWMGQVEEIEGSGVRYWIINAGGKFDFTAKWWEHARWQSVVDHFRGRILFVQVGENGHNHKPLNGVVDLRGKTDLRQLVRLVHHADGVACGVTLLMHLAAAVEVKNGAKPLRPCVVVAGGREPAHWEAYPGHRFLDTVGRLDCCASGGCWKSRVVALNDDSELDKSLCQKPVESASGQTIPRCLDMIEPRHVIESIEGYL